MKNNVLWYLSPIAFAVISATWISHSNLNNGAYEQVGAGRTIQSTSASGQSGNAQCMHELDENVTASAHPMRVAAGDHCPRT